MSKPTILFDKDGTLIDTEKHYHTAWLIAFEQYGRPITREIALNYRSLGKPFAEEYTKELCGPDGDINEIRRLRDKVYFDLLDKYGIELKPYVKETLNLLKEKGYRMVIVTASTKERAVDELTKIGLIDYFDDIVSAKTVKQGKPAPDCYLLACEKLGLNPKETFAVEDSPNGVEAAWRAGCRTVMIPDQTEPDERISSMLYAKCATMKEFANLL
ncbi:MAG: HAD family phosphatase [Lachnospiraceae bacterium]|nr:HAD family phosphatase [Lachnospiraceae bacterium]